MKKKLVIALALLLLLAMIGCSKDKGEPPQDESGSVDTEAYSEEPEPEESSDTSDDSGILSPEFKKTMDDYEAWFDHYCEVMKKYQDNPSDLELLSEMTDLLTEETAMLEQMENMDESEMNSAELAYYIEVTARIEKKLLEVMDY